MLDFVLESRLCKCARLLWLIIQDTSARIISCFVFGQFALVVCWPTVALMLAGYRSLKRKKLCFQLAQDF